MRKQAEPSIVKIGTRFLGYVELCDAAEWDEVRERDARRSVNIQRKQRDDPGRLSWTMADLTDDSLPG